MMESNKSYHYFFKFSPLGFALMFLSFPVISFISPDSVTINGETGQIDTFATIIFLLFALIFILIFFAIKDRFAIVEFGNQTVKIKKGGQERILNWLDIQQVRQIQFVTPPLYKLKTKDSDEVVWFNTEPIFFSVNGYTTDKSEMGDLIRKKKKELGL